MVEFNKIIGDHLIQLEFPWDTDNVQLDESRGPVMSKRHFCWKTLIWVDGYFGIFEKKLII